jgi:signal transduction histidine kinase
MIELKPKQSDLHEMLVRAVNGVYCKIKKKGMCLELDTFEDMTLTFDEHWTAEAVMNVLDNAVKYSPPGSAIRISVERRTSFVRVEISDEGIGIPREIRALIFGRFYRGSHPLVADTEGCGVGLYLTRMILEKQGGSISVKPGTKKGSVFVLHFYL